MKELIDFSVLLSVYAKENPLNLDIALESIFHQSLIPKEVVLVIDGPISDDLQCVIDKYLFQYNIFKTIKLNKNTGLGNALNIGIKHCNCEYIARMDTDDQSLYERFYKQISFISENRNYDIVGCNICEFDSQLKEYLDKKILPEDDENIKKYMKKRNGMNHMTVVFKKSSVLKAGGYKHMPFFEDYYLWVRMIQLDFKFYNLQEELVNVRGGNDMILRRGGFNYIKCINNFYLECYKIGFINFVNYFLNVIPRFIVALLPSCIRFSFYRKKLRQS